MIKRFSVFYVGQIDLDNVGHDGTAPDARKYSNDQLIQAYYNAEELAKHLDTLGYYAMWGAEHHFQREGYECFPNLILLGVHLAGITKNLKFGNSFCIERFRILKKSLIQYTIKMLDMGLQGITLKFYLIQCFFKGFRFFFNKH